MAFKDFFKIQKQGLEGMASVGVIGMHMVSGPLVGVAIGYGIDRFFDIHPWGKIVFLFIGIGAGFLNVYMDTRRLIGQMNRNQGQTPPAGGQEQAPQAKKASEDSAAAPNRAASTQTGKNGADEGADHGKI